MDVSIVVATESVVRTATAAATSTAVAATAAAAAAAAAATLLVTAAATLRVAATTTNLVCLRLLAGHVMCLPVSAASFRVTTPNLASIVASMTL